MNGKDIELSRRRVLGGIATVGAASAAAGAGTFAYFSDEAESTNNTISAGSLKLDTISTANLSLGSLAPGESTSEEVFSSTYTGDVSSPALDWGIITANDDTSGDLGSYADVLELTTAKLDREETTVKNYAEDDSYTTLADLSGVYQDVLSENAASPLNNEDTLSFTLKVTMDEDAGNDYQDASLDFGVAFFARQSAGTKLTKGDITVNTD